MEKKQKVFKITVHFTTEEMENLKRAMDIVKIPDLQTYIHRAVSNFLKEASSKNKNKTL